MEESKALAQVRTLLAYERNYLSIERTQLAQLRTGITLALITPTALAALTYAFEFLPSNYYISVVIYTFLAITVLYGVWIAIQAQLGLRKTRQIIRRVRQRQAELSSSPHIKEALKDLSI